MTKRLLILVSVATAMCSSLAWGQFTGLKQRIGDKLQGAEEEHRNAVNDAMGEKPAVPQGQNNKEGNAVVEIKSGWITRKSREGQEERLYFAYPGNLTKGNQGAGLIVLQEWWGVNDDIQERVREFAGKGFYAVAPDLYHGKVTADPAEAAKLKEGMKDADALVAMKTGLDLLQEEVRNGIVDYKRVGVIGWCMGGQQALLLSLADSRVKATAIFYGPLVTDAEQLKKLQGPVLGVFGNNDKAPSPEDVAKFKAGLEAAGKKDVTIYQYDGVGHAFASKSAEKIGLYNAEKAGEAWEKTWGWLGAKLLVKKSDK